jgi:hypothetical protein
MGLRADTSPEGKKLTAMLQQKQEDRVSGLIRQIRQVFENHFDRTWFSLIIDGLPIDFRTVREIRELVSLHFVQKGDEAAIRLGAQELESFIRLVRRYLLPVIKERLGVSGLHPETRVKDPEQYLIRRLVAYTFPYNLERLERLAGELKAALSHPLPAGDGNSAPILVQWPRSEPREAQASLQPLPLGA